MAADSSNITHLLARLRQGDAGAADEVVRALYKELHRLAVYQMKHESPQHTLQPTALVHEAYLRLLDGPLSVNDKHHFLALAAQTMRRVLVDHARQKRAHKRGRGFERVTLEFVPGEDQHLVDVLAMDEVLVELLTLDPRVGRVVELKFFGGYTDKEVGAILDVSVPTVRRDWNFARSWLKARLEIGAPP